MTPNHMRRAQTVLNSAARLIPGLSKSTRQSTLMETCGWLKMEEMAGYYSLTQMWKAVCWGLSTYLADRIQVDELDYLSTSRPRLQLIYISFRHYTVSLRNQMPASLRAETKIAKFKIGVKYWMKEKSTDGRSVDGNDDSTPEDNEDLMDRPMGSRPPDGMQLTN